MNRKIFSLFLIIGSVAILFSNCNSKKIKRVCQIAQKPDRPKGAAHYSDVSLSSRWRRPINENDPHDTFQTARDFHATRLDWVYSTDPTWIQECKKRGYHFVAALNSKLPDEPGGDARVKGRIRDRNGDFVTAPWMQGWDAWWGCANSPEYRKIFLDHAKVCLDGGADYFQVDDPDMNFNAVNWGGCFCKHCREKAEKLGIDLNDIKQMKQFQAESVTEFFREMRKQVDRYARRHVPFSCNNYKAEWTRFPYDQFEIGMAEVPENEAKPDLIYHKLLKTRKMGKTQFLVFVSEDQELTRKMIATTYACGSHLIVPWDVYLKSTPEGSIRFFGKPDQFADLYGFVRANHSFLDGFEDAAVIGNELNDDRYQNNFPLIIEGGSDSVYAFIRAVPGKKDAPVVIHLVDWGKIPKEFAVKILKSRFFPYKQFAAVLHVPNQYGPAMHQQAEQTKDFSRLSRVLDLNLDSNEHFVTMAIPKLDPWGMLILMRENDKF